MVERIKKLAQIPRHRRFQAILTLGACSTLVAQFHSPWLSGAMSLLTTLLWIWEQ